MILFLLISVLMVVLTLALLTRPLWWGRANGARDGSSREIREQLKQVESLRASGALGEEQAAQARAALQQRLSDGAASPLPGATAGSPRLLLPTLTLFVLLVAVAGYGWLGSPQGLDPALRQARGDGDAGGHTITVEQIQAMTEKLAARLKEQPDDVQGWAMLGRSYAVLGQHAQALPAFKQAMTLKPDDPVLIADYADALAVVNGRNLEGEPSRLIARALELDPNNLKALSLAGTAAFLRKDYALAIRHWEKMAKLSPDSELVKQIQGGIDEARSLAAGGGEAVAAPASPSAARPAAPQTAAPAGGASISGVVKLAAALTTKAAPEDTLFVYARAAQGSRMPLAILRKQVKDLPLTFTLDDSMAMSPAAKLSSAQQVVVSARISKRGDATPQPGDLQGQSAPVAPGARGLTIEIGQVVGP
jgi:cytochrome c-type biogenesis protein CcmH